MEVVRQAGLLDPDLGELSLYLGLVNALFAFGLLAVFRHEPPEIVRTEWFLFLGSSALLVLFAVRSTGPFWTAPPLSRRFSLTRLAPWA